MQWDTTFETGDGLVDEQHRNIFRLVDYAMSAQDDPDVVMHVLNALMDHVSCHFATEEDLMERSGYEGEHAEAHRIEPARLPQPARAAVLRFHSGETTSIGLVAEFVHAWTRDHIDDHDRRFIDFVRGEGLVARLPEPWAAVQPPPGSPHRFPGFNHR